MKYILNFSLRNKINILICDNCENDEIKDLYQKLKQEYKNIYYKKNMKEKNFDINCYNALNLPQTKYVWVIGDGLIIDSKKIEKILEYLEDDYDIIVFDYMDRLKNERIKLEYEDAVEFFKDIAWHATLLGSTIFKKSLIENTLKKKSSKYIGTYFMHLGILLEAISNKKFKGIIKKEQVCNNNLLKKKSTWSNITFNTFCNGWINFINLLPKTYNSEKEYVIKIHGVKSRLFSIKNFIFIKATYDEYTLKDIYKNRKNLKRVTNVPQIMIYLIWLVPKSFLILVIRILKKLKKGVYNE